MAVETDAVFKRYRMRGTVVVVVMPVVMVMIVGVFVFVHDDSPNLFCRRRG
jgi:hypothetical protein